MSDKAIRKPRLEKSKITGVVYDSQKLYDEVKQWNRYEDTDNSSLKGVAYGMGWAMSDLVCHGYVGEDLKREQEDMKAVINACKHLQEVLEDVLGIEAECYKVNLDELGYSRHTLIDTKESK